MPLNFGIGLSPKWINLSSHVSVDFADTVGDRVLDRVKTSQANLRRWPLRLWLQLRSDI